jgi:hypothetical protein
MKTILISFFVFFLLSNTSYAQFDNVIQLNGNNDYIEIPDNAYLDLTDSFTIEAWIQPLNTIHVINIFNKGTCSGNNYAYNLAAIDGKIIWMWHSNGTCNSNKSRYESIDSVLSPNECAYISVVHTTNSVKIFLNGDEIPGQFIYGGDDFSIFNSSANARIGTYKTSTDFENFFLGRIGELRIWDYAKTTDEIKTDMYAHLTGDESGLVAYYDMADSGSGTGTTITNKAIISGDQLNGTTYGTDSTPFFTESNCSIATNLYNIENPIFTIYPNPTNNSLKIEGSGHYQIQIFDIIGNLLIKKDLSDYSQINISGLSKGTYIVKISNNKYFQTAKIVINP